MEKKQKKPSTLTLSKKSIQQLTASDLSQVVGGKPKRSAGVTKTCSCTDDCLIDPCFD